MSTPDTPAPQPPQWAVEAANEIMSLNYPTTPAKNRPQRIV